MAKKKRKARDPRCDQHHIRPKSRGGGSRRNLVTLPLRFHALWHQLFVNLTVEEVHEFIDTVMVPDTEWDMRSLNALRERLMRRRVAA